MKTRTFIRKKIVIVTMICILLMIALLGRIGYLMIHQSQYYEELANQLHERERSIKAARGKIIDANAKFGTGISRIGKCDNGISDVCQ